MSKSREFKFFGAFSLNSWTDGESSSKITLHSSFAAVEKLLKD
jgi:hypothetical protein